MMEVVQVGREGSRHVVGEAEMHGGDMGHIGGGPGRVDGAMELGASRPYDSVEHGRAAGGVQAWGKRVGGGGPSERGAAAQGHRCGVRGSEG